MHLNKSGGRFFGEKKAPAGAHIGSTWLLFMGICQYFVIL